MTAYSWKIKKILILLLMAEITFFRGFVILSVDKKILWKQTQWEHGKMEELRILLQLNHLQEQKHCGKWYQFWVRIALAGYRVQIGNNKLYYTKEYKYLFHLQLYI